MTAQEHVAPITPQILVLQQCASILPAHPGYCRLYSEAGHTLDVCPVVPFELCVVLLQQ